MQRGNQWLCDTPDEPGCQGNAAVAFICRVEGRQVSLCRNCEAVWKGYARQDSQLSLRCPNCAPSYIARRNASVDMGQVAREREERRITSPEQPMLTGPLAEVIDNAMARSGVLVDARHRVLAELRQLVDSDESGYAAVLLRSADSWVGGEANVSA